MNAFEIKDNPCFDYDDSQYKDADKQELYNRGIASLYLKKLLINGVDDSFKLMPEIVAAFSIVKNCKKMIFAENKESSVCLYFDGGNQFTVFEMGERENEYIKVSIREKEELFSFLRESSFIKDTIISDEYLRAQEEIPLVGDDVISEIGEVVVNYDRLRELEVVSAMITIIDRTLYDNQIHLALISQPVQDKIFCEENGVKTLYVYSEDELNRIMGV